MYIYTYIIACDNCLHQLGRMWILITAPNEMRRTSKCFKLSPCWMHSIILRNPKLQQLEDLKWKPQYAAICFNQEAVISSFDSTKLLACIFLHQLSRMMIPKNQPIVTNLTKTWRPAYPCKHCRRGSSAGSALPGRDYHIHHKKKPEECIGKFLTQSFSSPSSAFAICFFNSVSVEPPHATQTNLSPVE